MIGSDNPYGFMPLVIVVLLFSDFFVVVSVFYGFHATLYEFASS